MRGFFDGGGREGLEDSPSGDFSGEVGAVDFGGEGDGGGGVGCGEGEEEGEDGDGGEGEGEGMHRWRGGGVVVGFISWDARSFGRAWTMIVC